MILQTIAYVIRKLLISPLKFINVAFENIATIQQGKDKYFVAIMSTYTIFSLLYYIDIFKSNNWSFSFYELFSIVMGLCFGYVCLMYIHYIMFKKIYNLEDLYTSIAKEDENMHANDEIIEVANDIVTNECNENTAILENPLENEKNTDIEPLIIEPRDISRVDIIENSDNILEDIENIDIDQLGLELNTLISEDLEKLDREYREKETSEEVLESEVSEKTRKIRRGLKNSGNNYIIDELL